MTTETKSKPVRKRNNTLVNGVVSETEAFTVAAFVKRLGITRSQLLRMRRRGMVTRQEGKYVRILGRDYLRYLADLPAGQLDELDGGGDERPDEAGPARTSETNATTATA